ncbi:MAG: hypothetical protein AB2693_21120, partial [Candidatus Thiodiazotropha sp.]
ISEIETVINSHADRLKLLEYRSLDLEARSRRRNLLFKGFSENRRENCFEEVRHFIQSKLNIDRDMYLERAHRLGRFNPSKTRPIIVAFRDFCDIDEILNASSQLKGTEYGVSKDYPSEISKARQSLWNQFKTVRANNPNRRVTLGYPAKISIDNETIVDLFPDWFQILQGSRVSRAQSTQSNGQNINTETGMASLLSLSSGTHMSMPTRDTDSESCQMGPDTGNCESVSPERAPVVQMDEQSSPSLLKNSIPHDNTVDCAADKSNSLEASVSQAAIRKAIPAEHPTEQLRGRSLTRKSKQAERRRAKSNAPHSQSQTREKSSRSSQSRVCKTRTEVPQQAKLGSKGNEGDQNAPPMVTDAGLTDDELTQMPHAESNQSNQP